MAKTLHRIKAIEAYKGGRLVLKDELVYSSYMLFKEATRSTLAYINEDIQGKEYSAKTKMRTLLTDLPPKVVEGFDMEIFNIFVDMDSEGLGSILSIEVETLKEIKRVLKKLMGLYLDAVL